ncbi:MAG TPA: hypothetical protein VFP22_09435 [Candidatus Limnocylindrales bacterium]|nr:hypothetical protein [Candidatus Limnocylindrales bacterium]
MPEITLPEVKLPDIKLPDGLRDMTRKDIQSAINDRVPRRVEMPDVDLSGIQLPKVVEDRLKSVEKRLDSIDLSNVPMPKALERRLPHKRRSNRILPLAAFLAVGSAFAAAWWLITSPTATTRVRTTADRMWRRLTGQQLAVTRYDDDGDLASLVPNPADTDITRPIGEADANPDTFSDLGETISVGNGSAITGADMPETPGF